ncbi:MAG: exodeoxyribonuclease small subunit [Chthoniobacter sp.]|jgi:exodeoxyribonuclease VII small subunit|nr:exodeoxyribonuclease small subunit [Chthoniobacter sp.]
MAKIEQPTFESAIERLESIVAQMESDSLPLEELLTRYEEGLKLVKVCSEKLTDAEKRIEIITRDAGGKPKLIEFEPAQKPPADTPKGPEAPDVRLF